MAGDPIKVTLLGAERVGKSTIVAALADTPSAGTALDYKPTIGASFKHKTIIVDDKSVALNIWDTAGQARFSSLLPMYYRGASIIVLVFDITNRDSFERLDHLLAQKRLYAPNASIILVGTKNDLESERKVSRVEAEKWGSEHIEGFDSSNTYVEVTANKDPEDLASKFLAVITAKLKLHIAFSKKIQPSSPQPHESTIQLVPETSPGSSGTAFFGLFSRKPPPPNSYILARKAHKNEISLSNDFKAIFNHLLSTAWLPNRKTQAAEAVLGTGTLNIETLRTHAAAESSSRTAQAIRIFNRLNEILNKPIPEHNGESLRLLNARAFLDGFSAHYLTQYAADECRLGIFVRSPEIHGLVTRRELTFDHSDNFAVAQNRIKIIKILYQADEKPNSRTARVVNAILASDTLTPSSNSASQASSSNS